jgi:hypothetical protein
VVGAPAKRSPDHHGFDSIGYFGLDAGTTALAGLVRDSVVIAWLSLTAAGKVDAGKTSMRPPGADRKVSRAGL